MTRILYVDDEPDIREIAQMALELEGDFDVRTASSGPEALEQAGAWLPDLILLDVMMPGMDGPAVLAQLRRRDDLAEVPVVFITARIQAQEVSALQALGARAVLAKPFDPISLGAQVRDLL